MNDNVNCRDWRQYGICVDALIKMVGKRGWRESSGCNTMTFHKNATVQATNYCIIIVECVVSDPIAGVCGVGLASLGVGGKGGLFHYP